MHAEQGIKRFMEITVSNNAQIINEIFPDSALKTGLIL